MIPQEVQDVPISAPALQLSSRLLHPGCLQRGDGSDEFRIKRNIPPPISQFFSLTRMRVTLFREIGWSFFLLRFQFVQECRSPTSGPRLLIILCTFPRGVLRLFLLLFLPSSASWIPQTRAKVTLSLNIKITFLSYSAVGSGVSFTRRGRRPNFVWCVFGRFASDDMKGSDSRVC